MNIAHPLMPRAEMKLLLKHRPVDYRLKGQDLSDKSELQLSLAVLSTRSRKNSGLDTAHLLGFTCYFFAADVLETLIFDGKLFTPLHQTHVNKRRELVRVQ